MKKLVLLAITLIAISCENKNDNIYDFQNNNQTEIESPDKIIGLGKKLENPYTVSVMKQAYDNIIKTKSASIELPSEELIIETTDYYVRFLPKNDDEKLFYKTKTVLLFLICH